MVLDILCQQVLLVVWAGALVKPAFLAQIIYLTVVPAGMEAPLQMSSHIKLTLSTRLEAQSFSAQS